MKKLWLIFFVAIIFSACQKKDNLDASSQQSNQVNNNASSVFTTIRDAVTKNITLKCEYTDEDGEKILTHIQGMKVRLKGSGEEADFEGLMRDGKYYLWSVSKKEGMIIDMTKFVEGDSVKMGERVIKSIDDVVAVLEEKKQNCSVVSVEANFFEIPGEVKFEDAGGFFE